MGKTSKKGHRKSRLPMTAHPKEPMCVWHGEAKGHLPAYSTFMFIHFLTWFPDVIRLSVLSSTATKQVFCIRVSLYKFHPSWLLTLKLLGQT